MSAATVLVDQLADARRDGVPFAEAWPDALAAALASVQSNTERGEWASVLGGMVGVWRDAFQRRPVSSHERALSLLADSSDREPSPGRSCEHCDGPIPDERDPRMIYCSDRCRRDASYMRTHAPVAA